MPKRKPEASEHDIQSSIIDYLCYFELGRRIIRLERRNGGVMRRFDGSYGASAYRLYLHGITPLTKGVPDIEGIFRDGRYFGIECKRVGGTLRKEQIVVGNYLLDNGLPYLVAKSVDDVKVWLDKIVGIIER